MPRRTKIVATLGPAVDAPETLAALIAAGMNVARVNLSHGSADDHQQRADRRQRTRSEADVYATG